MPQKIQHQGLITEERHIDRFLCFCLLWPCKWCNQQSLFKTVWRLCPLLRRWLIRRERGHFYCPANKVFTHVLLISLSWHYAQTLTLDIRLLWLTSVRHSIHHTLSLCRLVCGLVVWASKNLATQYASWCMGNNTIYCDTKGMTISWVFL